MLEHCFTTTTTAWHQQVCCAGEVAPKELPPWLRQVAEEQVMHLTVHMQESDWFASCPMKTALPT